MPLELAPYLAVLPAAIYSLLTAWCGRCFFGRPATPATPQPDVTIIKPVKGMDEGSYENFATFCNQRYNGKIQLLFAVADLQDPAIPVIRRLIEDYPHCTIELNIDPTIHGPNHKVSNLINAFPKARHDLLVICDSDIRVPEEFLSSVTSHFAAPEIGLVSSPYRSRLVHGPVTALEALAFTCEMTPNVLTALRLEGLSFALGAAMTFRRQALDDIGGLAALVNYLADDYQLGNKIHRAGWRLALDRQFVDSMMRPERFSGLLARQIRWARTMRVSRPGGYFASGITLPGLACLAAAAIPAGLHSLLAIILLYAIRLGVCTIYSRVWVEDRLLPRWAWLLPLRDLLAAGTWLLAFLGNRVMWRGQRFRIAANGTMTRC